MKVALDTNVLVYAEGVNDEHRQAVALRVIAQLGVERLVLPVQVLGELFRVLGRRGRMSRDEAHFKVRLWRDTIAVAGTSTTAFDAALDLTRLHQLQLWDAVILAVAAEAGCQLVLSEDLQEGFAWAGLTVVNPFAATVHPLLRRALHSD